MKLAIAKLQILHFLTYTSCTMNHFFLCGFCYVSSFFFFLSLFSVFFTHFFSTKQNWTFCLSTVRAPMNIYEVIGLAVVFQLKSRKWVWITSKARNNRYVWHSFRAYLIFFQQESEWLLSVLPAMWCCANCEQQVTYNNERKWVREYYGLPLKFT